MNFLYFYQSTALSSHTVDGHQMYFGGSIDLAHPSPNFHKGSKKSTKFGVVSNITQIWAVRVWKCSKVSELWNQFPVKEWSAYVLSVFAEVGSTHHWEPFVSFVHS